MPRARVKTRLRQIQLENKKQDEAIDLKNEIKKLKSLVDYYRFDDLTGLKTRKDLILEYDKLQFPISFILADINDLHNINRTLGYTEGDRFIRKMAIVLKTKFGFENTYRIGGDEFFIINHNNKDYSGLKNISCAEHRFEKKISYKEVIELLDKDIIIQKKARSRRKDDQINKEN